MRGPKPKSAAIRLLHARTLKQPAPPDVFAPEPYETLPEPPAYLNAYALAYWRELGAELVRQGLLTALDLNLFGALCQQLARLQQCQEAIDSAQAGSKEQLAWRR